MTQKRKNTKNSNSRMNMPRPSGLWIYGLIGAFIIAYWAFTPSNNTPVPSDWATVGEMVRSGDVEKIEIINRDEAQVYLREEAVARYRSDESDKRFRRMPESGAQLVFTIGSVDSFREDLKAAEELSGRWSTRTAPTTGRISL